MISQLNGQPAIGLSQFQRSNAHALHAQQGQLCIANPAWLPELGPRLLSRQARDAEQPGRAQQLAQFAPPQRARNLSKVAVARPRQCLPGIERRCRWMGAVNRWPAIVRWRLQVTRCSGFQRPSASSRYSTRGLSVEPGAASVRAASSSRCAASNRPVFTSSTTILASGDARAVCSTASPQPGSLAGEKAALTITIAAAAIADRKVPRTPKV